MGKSLSRVHDEVEENESISGYIMKKLRQHGSQIAQVDAETGESITFVDIAEKASELATALKKMSVGVGSVVLLMGENSPHYSWVLLGILETGAAAALINPRSPTAEVRHALQLSRPNIVILGTDVAKHSDIVNEMMNAACVREVFTWDSKIPFGMICLEKETTTPSSSPAVTPDVCSPELRAPPPTPNNLEQKSRAIPSSVALILQSSGSTGLPKGVLITHDNLFAALEQGKTFFQKTDVGAGLAPYFHAYGGGLMLMALAEGASMISFPKFSLNGLIQTIEKHKISVLHTVPSVLISLSRSNDLDNSNLESLSRIYTGASQVSPSVQQRIVERLPNVKLFHSYGMTETTFTVFVGEVCWDKPGSPGKLVPLMQCQVRNVENGTEVECGEVGELCFKGPMITLGYLANEEATEEAIDDDGWLRSGDLGYVDNEGYFFLVDRIKEQLKFNGHQVSPSELETVLLTHPAVEEAAVIGIPHEFGDAPMAFVVLTPGASATEEELQTFVSDKVAPHKCLRGGVEFVDHLLKTASGKIDRRHIRKVHLQEQKDVTSVSCSSSCEQAQNELSGIESITMNTPSPFDTDAGVTKFPFAACPPDTAPMTPCTAKQVLREIAEAQATPLPPSPFSPNTDVSGQAAQ